VPAFEILSLGDSALLLRSPGEIDLDALLRMRDRIAAKTITGVLEAVIGYASIAVFVDPSAAELVHAAIASLIAEGEGESANLVVAKLVEIPVCYDEEFAPDLPDVARSSGLSVEEVVRLHAAGEYRVRCIGFTPGFPYLAGLPPALATPRRATPRMKVPAGSVAIGGVQAGIYPTASPGGWNVIGRTPLRLFDAERNPPALLRAGDSVRFRSITHAQFLGTSAS
jgi:inhibitor of KinA